jgi:hypothetical protein
MPHTKRADQSDLVRRGGKQMRCFVRPQYFFGVRIKGDYHRRTIYRPSVFRGSGDHCLMPEMDAIEDTNGEKERAW